MQTWQKMKNGQGSGIFISKKAVINYDVSNFGFAQELKKRSNWWGLLIGSERPNEKISLMSELII